MPIGADKMRVQGVVDVELGERINELADRMGASQSQMVAMLLEAAVDDNEWLIAAVTSKLAKNIRAAFGPSKRRKKPASEAG